MVTCTFENNDKAQLRHAVVDVVVFQDDKLLFTKRAADMLTEPGKWALPGGYINLNETAVEAAMREVLEETRYTIEVQELLSIVDTPNRRNDERQNISFVFVAQAIKEVGEKDDTESAEVQWFPITALPKEKDIAFDHLEFIWQYIEKLDDEMPSSR